MKIDHDKFQERTDAIKNYMDELRLGAVSGSLPPIKDAVDFAKWVRDNTITDGAPKLFLRQYEKVNKDKSRYTMEELCDVYNGGNDR